MADREKKRGKQKYKNLNTSRDWKEKKKYLFLLTSINIK